MAAAKAELLLSTLQISDPLAGFPPLSPLDGYTKLEELQLLLQNAAAGGSLLAEGDLGEYGGEGVVMGCVCVWGGCCWLFSWFLLAHLFWSVSKTSTTLGGEPVF